MCLAASPTISNFLTTAQKVIVVPPELFKIHSFDKNTDRFKGIQYILKI